MLGWLKKSLGSLAPAASASPLASSARTAYHSGDWPRVIELLRRLAAMQPLDAEMSYHLGDALYQVGRVPEALPHLEQAARSRRSAACDYKLGNALKDLERLDEALASYGRALEQDPRHARALANSGVVLEMQGKMADAVPCYRRAIAADGALLSARINLAVVLRQLGPEEEAREACQGLRAVTPASAQEWFELGHAYEHLGQHDDAMRCLQRALETEPGHIAARMAVLTHWLSIGRAAEAIAGYRKILEAEPGNREAACKLLLALLFEPGAPDELFAEHLAFARRYAPAGRPRARSHAPRAEGRIRVGYVSADFSRHPVATNLAPVIRHHDRAAFEIFLYSDVKRPDELTQWFQEQAPWRAIAHMPDEEVADLIRKDAIDVLVILAGRFEDNRLLLATQRAAPVQVSMHDPATSGLEEMDYLIADRGLVPRRSAEKFTERIACLPTFYLRSPLHDAPPVAPTPAAGAGRITFGSFNNIAKINESVVALWARLLHRVPGSRLLLKYHDVFTISAARSRYVDLFRRHGIEAERLVLVDRPIKPEAQHLAEYAEIDIALDPFPFSGATTTFEALWMGVPVVTLQGDRMVARWTAAMLRKIGLSRLVAGSESGYVDIASGLAADIPGLSRLRAGLRERVARSPLCAERARTRQLERLYRRMLAIRLARTR